MSPSLSLSVTLRTRTAFLLSSLEAELDQLLGNLSNADDLYKFETVCHVAT
jgi:hypothetical protein